MIFFDNAEISVITNIIDMNYTKMFIYVQILFFTLQKMM